MILDLRVYVIYVIHIIHVVYIRSAIFMFRFIVASCRRMRQKLTNQKNTDNHHKNFPIKEKKYANRNGDSQFNKPHRIYTHVTFS